MNTLQIAQFGAFDIFSYGDTLFADAMALQLTTRMTCEITIFSKTACDKPYSPQIRVHAFEEFVSLHREKSFDAVVIGGGEMLHYRDIYYFRDGEEACYPSGMFWKRIIDMAYQVNVPVFICGVGAPYDFTQEQGEELAAYAEKVRWIAVRDLYSYQRLLAAGVDKEKVICTADNLWCLQKIFSKELLAECKDQLIQKTGIDLTSPYIAVQYGTTKNCKEVALQLDRLQQSLGMQVVLFPVNACHEDRLGNQEVMQYAHSLTIIDIPLSREEIAAIIAHSRLFLGTSFHGNLTAALHQVPFVGIDMYPSFVSKMDGLFMALGCEQYLVPEESSLYAAAAACLTDHANSKIVQSAVEVLKKQTEDTMDRLKNDIKRERV